jgi:hypothetical protein
VVGSQTASLTPGLSFDHNLCFRCPNGQCEPILDIYALIAFQWYEEIFKEMGFDPWNYALEIRESIGTPTPMLGVHLGVWGYEPSHFLHSQKHVHPMHFFGYSRNDQLVRLQAIYHLLWDTNLIRYKFFDSQVFLLVRNFATPCFGREPKAKVTTTKIQWPSIFGKNNHELFLMICK